MSSNLPPGCSSADGGIDHDWEAAADTLLDIAGDTEVLLALIHIVPGVKAVLSAAYKEGYQAGKYEQ